MCNNFIYSSNLSGVRPSRMLWWRSTLEGALLEAKRQNTLECSFSDIQRRLEGLLISPYFCIVGKPTATKIQQRNLTVLLEYQNVNSNKQCRILYTTEHVPTSQVPTPTFEIYKQRWCQAPTPANLLSPLRCSFALSALSIMQVQCGKALCAHTGVKQ